MTERPILFSAPMVRAILDGRKTQTRRVKNIPQNAIAAWLDGMAWRFDLPGAFKMVRCPYGVPGDRLWVRETWAVNKQYDNLPADLCRVAMGGDTEGCVDYLATPRNEGWAGKWRPSIHMPRWASRITLEITDVRVQRVQEISEEDARAEGVDYMDGLLDESLICKHANALGMCPTDDTPWFAATWDHIHGAGSWERNDWAWGLTFRRVTA